MKKIFFYMAMCFMVLELIYLNSRSLLFLIEDNDWIGKIFSVIGATTFSMFTILTMRTSNKKWMSIALPVFDVFWVLYGLNLRVFDTMLVNPVAFLLKIQFALFTGLVTYTLGTIDINTDKFKKDSDLESLKSKLTEKDVEIKNLRTELDNKQSENDSYNNKILEIKEDLVNHKGVIEDLQSQLGKCESELANYRVSFIKNELGRIRKKKVKNRTLAEVQIMEEAEGIHETIKV